MWNSLKKDIFESSARNGAVFREEAGRGLDVAPSAPQPQIAAAHFEERSHFRFLEAEI